MRGGQQGGARVGGEGGQQALGLHIVRLVLWVGDQGASRDRGWGWPQLRDAGRGHRLALATTMESDATASQLGPSIGGC
jgi:hypothetical protein